jgi:proline racemase
VTLLRELSTVEVHAEGEPSRVVLDASGLVGGATMAERFAYCRAHLQGLRRLLLREPRGHPSLCGAFVLPPVEPGSDFGLIVLEHGGFTPMSGSNTICAVTAVLESGLVPAREPVTRLAIDTAVGTVVVAALVHQGRVRSVTLHNVPAYVVELDRVLDVPGYGAVQVDVVFGGQFFVQAKAADLGLTIDPDQGREIARVGSLLKLAALEQVQVRHPLNPDIDAVGLVMLHSGDRVPGVQDRNVVVMSHGVPRRDDPSTWTGSLDRSPCGTGTCGRMAALYARGQLALGETFSHRSIIGTEFVGELVGETTVGAQPAVLPTLTGSAWVTGRATWYLDESDPFPEGFTVGDIWAPQP